MKNASHGLTAFAVLVMIIAAVLGFAFGIGFLIGKLLV